MGRMPDDMAARYGALLDEYDASIKLLNESKSETLTGLRAELKALGYQGAEIGAEVAMLKAAVKELGMTQVERQKADDKDEGVSDYVAILSLARARTREADIPHDAETGEIIEPTPAAQIAAGLTDALAVVKGEAEPHRVHQIPGNGAGTSSTAARKDVHQGRVGQEETPTPLTQQGFATPDSLGDEVGRPESATLQSETSGRVHAPSVGTLEPAGTQVPPVETIPGNGAGGAETEASVATVGATASANSSQATSDVSAVTASAHGSLASSAGTEGEKDRQPIQELLASQTTIEPDIAAVVYANRTALYSNPAVPLTQERGATGDRSAELPAAAPVAGNDYSKPNPICQDPDDCGVNASWNHTCGSCLRRVATEEAARAVQ